MVSERVELMERLPALEDWATGATALLHLGASAAPLSATPERLRSAIDAGMVQVAPAWHVGTACSCTEH